MNDIASLGLAVDSRPVATASRELERLKQSALTAEAGTARFLGTTRQASTATNAYARELDRLHREQERAVRSAEQLGRQIGIAARSFLAIAGVGVSISGSVRAVADASRQYVQLQNTLKVTGLEGDALRSTMDSLFAIAQRNGTAVEPLTVLYSRLAQAQKELNASGDDLLRFAEGISVALRVAGTDSQQASGALLQLSQAIGSAVVRAEEFNSINEGARPILQAVAAGLNEAGGSVSKLRALVVDGKVSSEAFFRAFLAGVPQLEQQAARAQGTVGQATERMQNAFIQLIGKLDETVGASRNAASNISAVADAIGSLPSVIDRAVNGFSSLQSYITSLANSPQVERLLRLMGVQFTQEEAAAAGLTLLRGTRLQGGSQLTDGGAGAFYDAVGMGRGGGGGVSTANFSTGKDAKTRLNEYERLTRSVERQIRAMEQEAQTFGQTEAAATRYRVEQELLNAAKAAGLPLTQKLVDEIQDYANRAAGATAALENLRKRQEAVNDASQAFGDVAFEAFDRLALGGENFNDVLQDITRSLIRMVTQAALLGQGPLAGILGFAPAGGNALGGILGSLLGGGGSAGGGFTGSIYGHYHTGGIVGAPSMARAVDPRVFLGAPRFHTGGIAGDEVPVIAKRGEGIFTPEQMRALGGAGPITVNVNNAPAGTRAEATARRDGNGGLQIDIALRREVEGMVAGAISSGESPINRAVESRYALNPARGIG